MLAGAIAGPAVLRAGILMPVRSIIVPLPVFTNPLAHEILQIYKASPEMMALIGRSVGVQKSIEGAVSRVQSLGFFRAPVSMNGAWTGFEGKFDTLPFGQRVYPS